MRVRDIMTARVVTVMPGTPIRQAAELIADHGYTALPVLDGRVPVGMVSEVDVLAGRFPHDPRGRRRPTTVAEVMAAPAVTVAADATIAELVELMWRHRHRCLPVVADRQLVGIVTRHDVMRAVTRNDSDIAEEVRARLAATISDRNRWRVAVVDGLVDIDDHWPDEAGRRTAIAVAETVRGVTAVHVTGPGGP